VDVQFVSTDPGLAALELLENTPEAGQGCLPDGRVGAVHTRARAEQDSGDSRRTASGDTQKHDVEGLHAAVAREPQRG
jgi:hypothetical protein